MPNTRTNPAPIPNSAFPRILEPEQSMQKAIQGVRDGVSLDYSHAASAHVQSSSSVRHRRTPHQAHQHGQKLSADEEETLADCIRISNAWGFPLSVKQLREMAERVESGGLSRCWPQRFIQRHNLHTPFAHPTIDANTAYNHNKKTVTDFIRLVKSQPKKIGCYNRKLLQCG